jgi:hypothetical protein
MKPKEEFLHNIQAKIKVLQDAYDFNKSLPDDVFESLFKKINNHAELPIITNDVPETVINKDANPKIDINEYGAKYKIVKSLIESNVNGIEKKSVINYLSKVYKMEKDKAKMTATNTIKRLTDDDEIEAFKRGVYRIKKAI